MRYRVLWHGLGLSLVLPHMHALPKNEKSPDSMGSLDIDTHESGW
jgi:hypothetical protein